MGKASRWLRSLFNLPEKRPRSDSKPAKENNCNPKWSFLKPSCKENHDGARSAKSARCRSDRIVSADFSNSAVHGYTAESRKAVAVAKASASAVEAAVLAAKAAAEVVRLTRRGRHDFRRHGAAAVVIQSFFRGYLARRAFRALRALVRLQALVRGYIVRKQAEDQVRKMHALIRAQARARAIRASFPASSESSSKTSHSCITDSVTPDITEYATQLKSSGFEQSAAKPTRVSSRLNRNTLHDQSKMHLRRDLSNRFDVNKIDKILEVDSFEPYSLTKSKNLFHLSDLYRQNLTPAKHSRSHSKAAIPYTSEDLYLQYCQEIDHQSFYTADDSPFFHTGSSGSCSARRGAYTPANSDFPENYLNGGHTEHHRYMADTKSSKAKLRSLSAPKQRTPQIERSVSLKCYSIYDFDVKRQSAARASCSSRAYNHGIG